MKENKIMKINKTTLISLSVVLILFIIPCFFGHMLFETNDDVFMKMILSGEYTGNPSPYVLFMNIILGYIISVLYRMFPFVPVYSIFFIIILMFSFSYFLYISIKQFDNKKVILWSLVCFVVLFIFVFSGFLIEMQFTLVAGIAGACGIYGLFFLNLTNKKSLIQSVPIVFLLIISFCIRENVFFMLIPFASVVLFKCLFKKDSLKNIIIISSVIVFLTTLLFVVNIAAYSSEEWSEFKQYNKSRSDMVDLYIVPQYVDYKETYEELGISYSSFIAFVQHYCTELDEAYNLSSMQKLSDIASNEYNSNIQIGSLFSLYINNQFSAENKPISIIVMFMYAFLIYMAIILYRKEKKKENKKRESIILSISIMLLLISRNVVWIYMIIHDKTPRRVTNGLFFVELLLLIALLIEYAPKVLKGNVVIGFVVFMMMISAVFGINNFNKIKNSAYTYYLMTYVYDDIRQYTDNHSENLYLCDTFSFSYFVNNDLKIEDKHVPNLIILGGWTANSPWHNDIYRSYEIDNILDEFVKGEKVYYIVQRTDGDDVGYIKDFIDEATGVDNKIQICDSIICGQDSATLIYDIYKVY